MKDEREGLSLEQNCLFGQPPELTADYCDVVIFA